MIGRSQLGASLALSLLLDSANHADRVAAQRIVRRQLRREPHEVNWRGPKVYTERELRAMRGKYKPHVGARQARPPVGFRR